MAKSWLIFLQERVPLPAHVLLVGGMLASAYRLSADAADVLLAAIGLILFFITLRLMDECKDYAVDCVVFPERPLPRGLIGLSEARAMVTRLLLVMAALTGVLVWRWPVAALCYGLALSLLWLMYNEYFMAQRLQASPLLYATTHQLVAIPMALFTCAMFTTEPRPEAAALGWSALVLSGFFIWEVGRKLWLPREREGYLLRYGWGRMTIVFGLLIALGAAGALVSGSGYAVLPVQTILVATLVLCRVCPRARALAEPVTTLTLAVCIWGPALERWL